MNTAKKRILVLDGMWNKSLAAVRSLGRRGFDVAAGERTRFATALFSKYCKKRMIYPSPLSQTEAFIDSIENELRTGDYDVVFPMEFSTQMLLTSSPNRKRIERFARLPFADMELTKNINNKAFLMRYAQELGIGIPQTYFPHEEGGCTKTAGDIDYPVLIKPRNSSGSRGIVYVEDKDEFVAAYNKVHEKYPLPIVQEYIPDGGGTFGVGLLLNRNSEIRASFVYKRLRTYPVSGGPSTLRESVRKDDVREIAEYLMKSVGWNGVAHVEFKVDPRDGRPKLLEVNPRFWGSLELAIRSGVDFPFLLYKMAMEGDVDPQACYDLGVRCRWLLPGDILHFLNNPERFHLDPDFFDFSIRDDIISLHDPWPVIGRLTSALAFLYHSDMRNLLKH